MRVKWGWELRHLRKGALLGFTFIGPPLAPLGLPGALWDTLASQGELGMTLRPIQMDTHFRANGSQPRMRVMGANCRKSCSSQLQFTRAEGQDNMSSEQTPSNYEYEY